MYDIEFEVHTSAYKCYSCGKELLVICDIGHKQALNRLQLEFELGTSCSSSNVKASPLGGQVS